MNCKNFIHFALKNTTYRTSRISIKKSPLQAALAFNHTKSLLLNHQKIKKLPTSNPLGHILPKTEILFNFNKLNVVFFSTVTKPLSVASETAKKSTILGDIKNVSAFNKINDTALPKDLAPNELNNIGNAQKLSAYEENYDVDEWVVENDSIVKKFASNKDSSELSSEKQLKKQASEVENGIINESKLTEKAQESGINDNQTTTNKSKYTQNLDPKHLGLNQEEKYTISYAKMALNGTIHPFDTDKAISLLIQSNLDQKKSKAIIESLRSILIKELASMMKKQATSDEVEINHYKIKAQLQQLRTEMLMMRKNNQSLLVSEFASTSRDLDGTSQLIKDEIANLRSEISINLNNRRYKRNISIKDIEMKYHENEKKYYNLLGSTRTYLESTKLNIIRQGLLYFVIIGVFVFLFLSTESIGESKLTPQSLNSELDNGPTITDTLLI
ncbi:hypothetical protein BB561_004655 [Smittium simulii]|uniref:Uncharacterized protein n=1 Tax=Smittium simulii TaxID=133385 RepID=A0A2T9YEZ2_9FUNG|nr:hypothetical protein BB561_004655 [Smittium simulii]